MWAKDFESCLRPIFLASRMAEKAAAIYVAESGTADGPGTMEKPFKDALAALIKTAGNVSPSLSEAPISHAMNCKFLFKIFSS